MSDIPSGMVITMVVALIMIIFCYFFFGAPHGNVVLNAATDIYNTLTEARSGLGM